MCSHWTKSAENDARVREFRLLLVHTMIERREKCAPCNNAGTTAHMNFDDELIRLMMTKWNK